VREIVRALLDALDCAHSHGVWHRDVKPANLIVTTRGEIKLTDFGIARLQDMSLTLVNSTIGTPGYMAPEQYIGEAIDHRVDIFAAGVLLYRLLTGVAPFVGSPETVMYKILNENPRPPSSVQPGRVAAPFDAVIARAMAKAADQRYPSARAFREALDLLPAANPTAAPGAYGPTVDATIVRPTGYPARPPSLPGTGGSGSGSGGVGLGVGSQVCAVSDAMKTQTVALLTRHLGPVARVVVKRAGESASSREDFIARVLDTVAPAEKAALRRALEVIH
jgi:serine/threonine-protein kinase